MRTVSWMLTYDDNQPTLIDNLLVTEKEKGRTRLSQLRQSATSNSPKAILGNIEKITFLKQIMKEISLAFSCKETDRWKFLHYYGNPI